LTRISGGSYVLGPRIVQLELLMREIDPVSRTGEPLIQELVRQTGCDVLLANMYGDHIVNVLHERGVEHLPISYDRGRPHPLFRGAMSKGILAFLPRARALRLYNAHAQLAAESGMGRNWRDFWQALQQIRKKGYSESYGELDPGVIGVGAPVFNGDEIMGSVSIGCSRARLALLNKDMLVELLLATARRIGNEVERISQAETRESAPVPA
jgi:DNA-binding IclR family transcriptional regulator